MTKCDLELDLNKLEPVLCTLSYNDQHVCKVVSITFNWCKRGQEIANRQTARGITKYIPSDI